MRKYLAATAVLSSALLLTACSGDSSSEDPTASATTDATTDSTDEPTDEPTQTTVDVTASCAGFYDGGENSLATLVDTTAPMLATEVTEDTATSLTTAQQKIGAVQRFADASLQDHLAAVKAPYDDALAGETVDAASLQPALDALRAECESAGYEFDA